MYDRWEEWFEPGETLLWEGHPAPGFRYVWRNVFFTAFGIPFLGAGLFTAGLGLSYIFALGGIWEAALGIVLTAFGIPFITVGAGMMAGPWLHEYLRPTRVRYALTDRNAYIASRFWKRNMEVLALKPEGHIELEEHGDGTVSLYFHFHDYKDSDGDRRTDKKGFEALSDGREVYRLLRQQLEPTKEDGK